MPLTSATHRASFTPGDERSAKQAVDLLTEIFFEGEAAIAAFERPDGRWDVTVHFADAPDQALVRQAVSNAAGEHVAGTIAQYLKKLVGYHPHHLWIQARSHRIP